MESSSAKGFQKSKILPRGSTTGRLRELFIDQMARGPMTSDPGLYRTIQTPVLSARSRALARVFQAGRTSEPDKTRANCHLESSSDFYSAAQLPCRPGVNEPLKKTGPDKTEKTPSASGICPMRPGGGRTNRMSRFGLPALCYKTWRLREKLGVFEKTPRNIEDDRYEKSGRLTPCEAPAGKCGGNRDDDLSVIAPVLAAAAPAHRALARLPGRPVVPRPGPLRRRVAAVGSAAPAARLPC